MPTSDLRVDQRLLVAARIASPFWGICTLAALLIAVPRLRLPPLEALLISLTCLTAPAMLNAFGHYDHEMMAVLGVVLWGAWMMHLSNQQFFIGKDLLILIAILLFATWSEPLLSILALFSAIYFLLRPKHIPFRRRWIYGMGIVIGIMPLVIRIAAFPDYLGDLVSKDFLGIVATRLAAVFLITLPSLVLLPLLWHPIEREDALPIHHTAMLAGTATLVLLLTIPITSASGELLHLSMLGAILLWALLTLYWSLHRSILRLGLAALLSIPLFGGTVYLQGSSLFYPVAQEAFSVDQSRENRRLSPYIAFAQRLAINQATSQEALLAALEKGFQQERLPKNARIACLQHYITWCFELDRLHEGRAALLTAIQHYPDKVPPMWEPGQFGTERGRDSAYLKIQNETRDIIDINLQRNPDHFILLELKELLERYAQSS